MESYFIQNNENIQEQYNILANVCLEQIMLHSDSYICMMNCNLKGYKYLHRELSKKFQDLYLDLQKEANEMFCINITSNGSYSVYKPESFREHMYYWNEKGSKHIEAVSEAYKNIFEEKGYLSCVAKEIQQLLYRNVIKNRYTINRLCDLEWDCSEVYKLDDKLHHKLKSK